MPEQLSPALRALVQRVDEFATRQLLPLCRCCDERILTPGEAREQVIAASRAAGLFGMTQPRVFGGSEASILALTAARDTLAAHNLSLSHWVFGPRPGVLEGCAPALKQRYLEPLMAGDMRGAFAFTEPDDAARHTWGEHRDDRLTINGRKSYVTDGACADFLTALVNIEHSGPAMVIIDTAAHGVRLVENFATLDGGHHAVFEFVEVTVPNLNIIGRPGEGLLRAMRQIGDVRLSMAAEAAGSMRWVLDYLEHHLLAPHRSGEPLAQREGVRLRYAQTRINAYAARSMVYRTARLADQGDNVVNEAIACKVFTTETLGRVVDTAIELVGGKALTVGHPLERLYRRVRSTRLAEGANDILRLNLARGRLDLGKGRI